MEKVNDRREPFGVYLAQWERRGDLTENVNDRGEPFEVRPAWCFFEVFGTVGRFCEREIRTEISDFLRCELVGQVPVEWVWKMWVR